MSVPDIVLPSCVEPFLNLADPIWSKCILTAKETLLNGILYLETANLVIRPDSSELYVFGCSFIIIWLV